MSTPSEQVSDHPARHRGAQECKSLIAAANKDLFRKNAFRITGLPVDATPREASRHVDELKMQVELGKIPHRQGTAYPLNPPPSLDDIREAIQKIRDPEQRLIDEFFWFWPGEYGDSKSDPALQALAKGDTKIANEIWQARIKDESYGIVAKHNLAVAYLMVSVELEYLAISHTVSEERLQKITDSWKSSIRKWSRIAEDDELWEKVADRIRQLNEANLPTGFARRMRTSFPEAFHNINVELILDLAKSGHVELAKQHLQYLREHCHHPQELGQSAARVLLPAKNRLQEQIRLAVNRGKKNPRDAANAARELLKQSHATLELFDIFYGENSDERHDLLDEVVSVCNRLQIVYFKETGDDKTCLEILKAILPIAKSTELKQLIEKDISETCTRLESKKLEPVYTLLKSIKDSKDHPRSRLRIFNADLANVLISATAGLPRGSESRNQLLDTAAIVLRGISLDAWNTHQDSATATAANDLAIKYACDPDLKERLLLDRVTLRKNAEQNHHSGIEHIKYEGSDWIVLNEQRKQKSAAIGAKRKHWKNIALGWLVVIVIWIIAAIISSCNSTDNSSSNSSYTPSPTPSAPAYTPPPVASGGNEYSGNNTYRVPSYASSQLDREKTAIEADRAVLKQLDDQLDSLGRQIELERTYLDKTSQYAVDTFNAKVDRYNELSRQDKAATAAFNVRVDNYNANLRTYSR
jgi:hypothetical protein